LRCGHLNGGMSKKSRDEDLSELIVNPTFARLLQSTIKFNIQSI